MMRSKGALAFSRLGGTQEDIGERIGVTHKHVSEMRAAKRKPSVALRQKIQEVYGIPAGDWDVEVAPVERAPSVEVKSLVMGSDASVAALEDLARTLMTDVESAPDATPMERAKMMASLGSTMVQLRRLKGEALSELNVIKHPAWLALCAKILDALDPYPEAREAVLRAVEEKK